MKIKKHFKLFANVVVVKGNYMAAICDLQRAAVYRISNDIASMIDDMCSDIFADYYNRQSEDEKKNIDNLLIILQENELGFWTDTPKSFPKLNMTWKSPELINNAIIELNSFNEKEIIGIANDLKTLHCKHVEVRQLLECDISSLSIFMKHIRKSKVRSVIIFSPYNDNIDFDQLNLFVENNQRVVLFILHSSGANNNKSAHKRLKFLAKPIKNIHCGNIEQVQFSIRIPTFTESQEFNTCLNKKISIASNGDIKNCPSMSETFGNIRDTTLVEAVEKPEFKKYWGVNKDKIHVCKDCEFRYICTDCRGYIEDPEDILSKPLKCGYNPYSGEWSEWSTNPLKQKAIDFYGMREMVGEISQPQTK